MPNPNRPASRTPSMPIPGASTRSIEDILNFNALDTPPATSTGPHRERSQQRLTARSLYSALELGRPSAVVRRASASSSVGATRHALGGGSGPPWGAHAASTSAAPVLPGSFGVNSAIMGFEPRVIGGSGVTSAERSGAPSRRDPHVPSSPTRTSRLSMVGRHSAVGSRDVPIRSHHAPPPTTSSSSSYGHHILGSGAPTTFKRPSYLQYSSLCDLLQTDVSSPSGSSRPATFLASGRDATPFTESDDDSSSSGGFSRMPYSHRERERGRERERQNAYAASTALVNADPVIHLPTRWNEQDRNKFLHVSEDGRNLHFHGPTSQGEKEAAAARANYPIPPACGIYYYEVTVLDKGHKGHISVGFSCEGVRLNRLPGWEKNSWGYHGDDGHSFASERDGTPFGPRFTTGDVVGCGIDFSLYQAFYTKNGSLLGYPFDDIGRDDTLLFPSVGLRTQQEGIRVNFGQEPFKYDIDYHVHCARERTWAKIQATSVKWMLDEARDVFELEEDKTTQKALTSGAGAAAAAAVKAEVKQEPQDEGFAPIELPIDYSEPINRLVVSYLEHHGFDRTAIAFKTQAEARKKKASAADRLPLRKAEDVDVDIKMETDDRMPEPSAGGLDERFGLDNLEQESNPARRQSRQRVVHAVLAADIDLALRLTQELFPSVLEMDNGLLLLKLKCRKFVELMLHASDALQIMRNESVTEEGEASGVETGAMEVDDEGLQSSTNGSPSSDAPTPDVPSSTAALSSCMKRTSSRSVPSPAVMQYQIALSEALAYGKTLHAEHHLPDAAARPEALALLKTTFSLAAYDDPRTAGGEVQALASQEARAKLAQEVNQAVLESQGRPNRPALERLYRQTNAVLTQLAMWGVGEAAFADIRREFLDS